MPIYKFLNGIVLSLLSQPKVHEKYWAMYEMWKHAQATTKVRKKIYLKLD